MFSNLILKLRLAVNLGKFDCDHNELFGKPLPFQLYFEENENLARYSMITTVIIYKQQFLHSDWLRACQLIPNQCKKVKLSAKR